MHFLKTKNKKTGFYCIPTEKLSDIKKFDCITHWKARNTTARKLGKACGKLISTKFVFGDIMHLKPINLYKVMKKQRLWDFRMNITNLRKGN